MNERTIRAEMLLGAEAMEKLKNAHVAVFGLGGVGSWCAEALARSGVGHLTLIDQDTVGLSNINRQLCALTSTVGMPKAEVVRQRLEDINPDADVKTIVGRYDAEHREDFFADYDFIVDCIDLVACKVDLIRTAKSRGIPIVSALGTGNKCDAQRLTLCDIKKTSGCPLARVVRKELRSIGIQPDIIVLRCDEPIDPSIFHKIALFCNVKPDCVIENMTIPVLYEAPIMLEKNNFSSVVCRELNLKTKEPDMTEWSRMVEKIRSRKKTVTIGLVGKYIKLHDAYLSVVEALNHAGYEHGTKVEINWIDSELITQENAAEMLKGCDGILVPGGFGNRGIEGMIYAAQYARESNVPYLGICLGMQIAVIEFARHVLGLTGADSGEFAPECRHKVIDFMPGQGEDIDKGGTLRLGSYPCVIAEGTTMARCYGGAQIWERHRHRYEFNNDYRDALRAAGMTISGLSPDGRLVEAVELSSQPFYVGVQYHPEFKSRPTRPHPLFQGFLAAAVESGK